MTTQPLCPDADLERLMAAVRAGEADDLRQADRLIASYPADPRLHFLRGSLLASIGRPIEALAALKAAVELAPDFSIARFQLGFFQLTSGEPLAALETWGPIALLPEGHYLRFFVGGLTHLIRDEFDEAVRRLQEGIAVNGENPPLNGDMTFLVRKIEELRASAGITAAAADDMSPTSLLLGQFAGRDRMN